MQSFNLTLSLVDDFYYWALCELHYCFLGSLTFYFVPPVTGSALLRALEHMNMLTADDVKAGIHAAAIQCLFKVTWSYTPEIDPAQTRFTWQGRLLAKNNDGSATVFYWRQPGVSEIACARAASRISA